VAKKAPDPGSATLFFLSQKRNFSFSCKIFQVLVFKTLRPDPELTYNAGLGSALKPMQIHNTGTELRQDNCTVKWGNIVTFLTFNKFFLNNS
jgi:hypothetical protein